MPYQHTLQRLSAPKEKRGLRSRHRRFTCCHAKQPFEHPPLTHKYTYTHTSSSYKARAHKLYSFAIVSRFMGSFGAITEKRKKKGSSSAKPWRQTERRPSDRYEEDGKVECTIRKRGRFLQSNSASKCFFAKKQSFIYLLLDPRALPRDDVMCIHTPGGLLTAQRLLSTWVSSSHTPPWLPEERKREKVSYRPCFSNIITLLCASENAHTHCPSANIKRRSSVTDDTSINRFTERKRKKKKKHCLAVFEVWQQHSPEDDSLTSTSRVLI